MDPVLAIIAGRVVERLIIASGGILSLWLGHRLFWITAQNDSKAELSGQSFKFKAERIGPGVFFALFGALLLGYLAFTRINVTTEELKPVVAAMAVSTPSPNPTKGPDPANAAAIPVGRKVVTIWGDRGVEPDGIPSSLRAVNTLVSLGQRQPQGEKSLSPGAYPTLMAAIPPLEQFQRAYVDERLGPGTFDVVMAMERECAKSSPRCDAHRADPKRREEMDEVRRILGVVIRP